MNCVKAVILENIEIAPGIYEMKVGGEFSGKPGQFYMLKAWDREPVLSRPLSIYDLKEDYISFVYAVKGRGTEVFAEKIKGEAVFLWGPLGNGFPLEEQRRKIALVGGGLGIVPLFGIAKTVKNSQIEMYFGFRDKSFLLEEYKGEVNKLVVVTESGAEGKKGYVTDYFDATSYDAVFCCGPEPMMKKIQEKCKKTNTPLWLSLEKTMACGVGACLVCTCQTSKGMVRTCKEGPVFSGDSVLL